MNFNHFSRLPSDNISEELLIFFYASTAHVSICICRLNFWSCGSCAHNALRLHVTNRLGKTKERHHLWKIKRDKEWQRLSFRRMRIRIGCNFRPL